MLVFAFSLSLCACFSLETAPSRKHSPRTIHFCHTQVRCRVRGSFQKILNSTSRLFMPCQGLSRKTKHSCMLRARSPQPATSAGKDASAAAARSSAKHGRGSYSPRVLQKVGPWLLPETGGGSLIPYSCCLCSSQWRSSEALSLPLPNRERAREDDWLLDYVVGFAPKGHLH